MDIPRAVYFINFSSLKVGFFPYEDFAVFKYEVSHTRVTESWDSTERACAHTHTHTHTRVTESWDSTERARARTHTHTGHRELGLH